MNELEKPADPLAMFQQRVADKLRQDIGGMLPDEVLKALVQRAVDEQFFKKRTVTDGYRQTEKVSWFVEEVAKHAEPFIRQYITQYMDAHKDEIQKAMTEYLKGENLMLLCFAALRQQTLGDIEDVARKVADHIRMR